VSRRANPLAQVNLLELRPVRAAEWEDADERVVVTRPPASGRGLARLLDWLQTTLAARRIRLDPVGSFAWRRLDGSRSVAEVAAELRVEFGDAVEPAEERLGHLVRQLRREKLLAYPDWDRDERTTS